MDIWSIKESHFQTHNNNHTPFPLNGQIAYPFIRPLPTPERRSMFYVRRPKQMRIPETRPVLIFGNIGGPLYVKSLRTYVSPTGANSNAVSSSSSSSSVSQVAFSSAGRTIVTGSQVENSGGKVKEFGNIGGPLYVKSLRTYVPPTGANSNAVSSSSSSSSVSQVAFSSAGRTIVTGSQVENSGGKVKEVSYKMVL